MLELWASPLRNGIRLLFTQEQVAASAGAFLDGFPGNERRKMGLRCGRWEADSLRDPVMLSPAGELDQDYAAARATGGVVLCGLLASHGAPLKALHFADSLLNPRAAFIECLGEGSRLVLRV